MTAKYSEKCGSPLKEGAKFCTKCGYKLPETKEMINEDQESVRVEEVTSQETLIEETKRPEVVDQSNEITQSSKLNENKNNEHENFNVRNIRTNEQDARSPSKYDVSQPRYHETLESSYEDNEAIRTGPTMGNLITIGVSSVIIVIMVMLLVQEIL